MRCGGPFGPGRGSSQLRRPRRRVTASDRGGSWSALSKRRRRALKPPCGRGDGRGRVPPVARLRRTHLTASARGCFGGRRCDTRTAPVAASKILRRISGELSIRPSPVRRKGERQGKPRPPLPRSHHAALSVPGPHRREEPSRPRARPRLRGAHGRAAGGDHQGRGHARHRRARARPPRAPASPGPAASSATPTGPSPRPRRSSAATPSPRSRTRPRRWSGRSGSCRSTRRTGPSPSSSARSPRTDRTDKAALAPPPCGCSDGWPWRQQT